MAMHTHTRLYKYIFIYIYIQHGHCYSSALHPGPGKSACRGQSQPIVYMCVCVCVCVCMYVCIYIYIYRTSGKNGSQVELLNELTNHRRTSHLRVRMREKRQKPECCAVHWATKEITLKMAFPSWLSGNESDEYPRGHRFHPWPHSVA